MHDPTDTRSARIADAHWMFSLAARFRDVLPIPSVSAHVASFNYTGTKDAATAAGEVQAARGLLSRQLGVIFTPHEHRGAGSQENFMYEAELGSGMLVVIVARAEVGPLVEARQDAGAKVPVAA
jgi:hypothetical protein